MKLKLTFLALLFSASALFSQNQYKVYSALMYHVIKNTQWPAGKAESSVIIGVLGSTDMIKELKTIASVRSVNGNKIVVKELSNSDVASCDVVFLSSTKSNQLSSFATAATSSSVLLVSETNGGASNGAVVNLTTQGGKPIIELNNKQAIQNKLKMTAELKKLAKLVN